MNKTIVLSVIALTVVVTGCATSLAPNQVSITYETQPPGAMLYDAISGTAWGQSPQTRIYTLKLPGQDAVATVTAVWGSGAKKTDKVRITTSVQRGTYTLSRPVDAPGLDRDLAIGAPAPTTVCTKIGASMICQ